VVLDHKDYTKALTYALKLAPSLAGTDFGSTRQRDLGQLWTDSARGFLGEIALARFFDAKFGVTLSLDYSLGSLEQYLPSDITGIVLPDNTTITPQIATSIKTTKFTGLWLDVPGAQIDHSDVFVLVKLGITRDHFVSFLKWISFVRDKLLNYALQIEAIDEDEAEELWNILPEFRDIPCYIAGFLDRELIDDPPPFEYRDKHKRDGSFNGYLMQRYMGSVIDRKPDLADSDLTSEKWEFEAIGQFSPSHHFVANSVSSLRNTVFFKLIKMGN